MKFIAEIDVISHQDIPDAAGETVASGLRRIGIEGIEHVRIGKHISLTLEAISEEEARKKAGAACEQLLANPVIETYSFFIHSEEIKEPERKIPAIEEEEE